jgi:hypothetical protein
VAEESATAASAAVPAQRGRWTGGPAGAEATPAGVAGAGEEVRRAGDEQVQRGGGHGRAADPQRREEQESGRQGSPGRAQRVRRVQQSHVPADPVAPCRDGSQHRQGHSHQDRRNEQGGAAEQEADGRQEKRRPGEAAVHHAEHRLERQEHRPQPDARDGDPHLEQRVGPQRAAPALRQAAAPPMAEPGPAMNAASTVVSP